MAFDIFGFQLTKKKTQEVETIASVVSPTNDGSLVQDASINAGGLYSYGVDMDGVVKSENETIRRYREIAIYPEVDFAIEDITNEAIVSDQEEDIVTLNLDELKVSEGIKNKMSEAFEEVLSLLDFNKKGSDIFRQWYVDGRLSYHLLFKDDNKKNGLSEVRLIDPFKIKKIREIKRERTTKGVEVIKSINEYFVYNDRGIQEGTLQGIKLTTDSVVYVPSGLTDVDSGITVGYLQKAVKPTNQLKMMEDSLVIYRMSRAPERRIFYIDVGDMPKMKAEQYVKDMMDKFRNKLVYDAKTGEIADAKKHMCLTMDTRVPLLDGRVLTLTEIEQEYKTKDLWAYSCDPQTGKFVPGLITWAGVSNPNAQVMKITLDNGKTITCTPEHRFPVWNKGMVPASSLVVGESMIPFYERKALIGRKGQEGVVSDDGKTYHQIFDNENKKWVFTHREVSEWKDSVGLDNKFIFREELAKHGLYTVHHKNINRFDNSPENLTRMNSKDHIAWHRNSGSGSGKIGGQRCHEMGVGCHNKNHPKWVEWHVNAGLKGGKVSSERGVSQLSRAKGRKILKTYLENEDFNRWFRERQTIGWTQEKRKTASAHAKRTDLGARGNLAQKEQWRTEERRSKHREMYRTAYNQDIANIVLEGFQLKKKTSEILSDLNVSHVLDIWKDINKDKSISPKQKTFDKFVGADLSRIVEQFFGMTLKDLRDSISHRNHKITSIEYLEERVDTGCLTIDGNGLYHSHHTFALEAGIYTENSAMEDFWMPRRNGGKGTEITTLAGGATLGQIDDVTYFLNKLYRSLNVPISRLNPETGFSLGRSNEISRDEIRFSKFIDKLRLKFSNLFLDLLRIQFVAKGIITIEEWEDIKQKIKFDFSRDNHFTELKESEILNNRVQTMMQMDAFVGKYFSRKFVQKKVLRLTDEEIKEMDQENKDDPVLQQDQESPPNQEGQ